MGLIPAHAGKTPTGRARPRRCRAHPRHAGKTHETPAKKGSSGAHPHSRGENEALAASDATDKGSSPLTRGKLGVGLDSLEETRLIPTHARKTSSPARRSSRCRAHPRSRGENAAGIASVALTQGSSPLTRGKLQIGELTPPAHRLIPARTGKTCLCRLRAGSARAHPRSRGENHGAYYGTSGVPGSSPLTRGKLLCGCARRRLSRLIPAHAGKTLRGSRPPAGSRAHPHSHGENTRKMGLAAIVTGSSPLTRGKRCIRGLRGGL